MWRGVVIRLRSSLSEAKAAGASASWRDSALPPAPSGQRKPFGMRILDWLRADGWQVNTDRNAEDRVARPHAKPLDEVRLEFVLALEDIPTAQAEQVTARIRRTRSLRDLWHMRTELFNAIACYRGQGTAAERFERLNRHFPARAPDCGTPR